VRPRERVSWTFVNGEIVMFRKNRMCVCVAGLALCMASVGWAAEGPERPAGRQAGPPPAAERGEQIFQNMDRNGDGLIDPEEFQAFAPRVMQRMRQAEDLPAAAPARRVASEPRPGPEGPAADATQRDGMERRIRQMVEKCVREMMQEREPGRDLKEPLPPMTGERMRGRDEPGQMQEGRPQRERLERGLRQRGEGPREGMKERALGDRPRAGQRDRMETRRSLRSGRQGAEGLRGGRQASRPWAQLRRGNRQAGPQWGLGPDAGFGMGPGWGLRPRMGRGLGPCPWMEDRDQMEGAGPRDSYGFGRPGGGFGWQGMDCPRLGGPGRDWDRPGPGPRDERGWEGRRGPARP